MFTRLREFMKEKGWDYEDLCLDIVMKILLGLMTILGVALALLIVHAMFSHIIGTILVLIALSVIGVLGHYIAKYFNI